MYAYVIRRILATIPVMLVVAVLVFLLLRLSPGDPAAIVAGDQASSEDIALIREKLALIGPCWSSLFYGSASSLQVTWEHRSI